MFDSHNNVMKKNTNKNPFKTPKSYFESFEDKLMEKLSVEESVIPKKEGFVAPEGYFDTLQSKLNEKLAQKEEETKVIKLNPYRKYYVAAASIAAILIMAIGFNWNKEQEVTFADLANSDIEAYFDNTEFELTTYEIAEVLPVDNLQISDMLEFRLDEDNVIDYLNDTIDDFEELNIEEDE